MAATTTRKLGDVRHEYFCPINRPDTDPPRIEGFPAYADNAAGQSRPAAFVTRCVECGAASYEPIETKEA